MPVNAKRPSVVAVIVTYNRRDLLRRALKAIFAQTFQLDRILLVDNASSDGTCEMVKAEFPEVDLRETGSNLGGAGGFAFGIDQALRLGPAHIWIMDDDAIPEANALEELLIASSRIALARGVEPAFVTSLITDETGGLGPRNKPYVSENFDLQYQGHESAVIAVTAATFVGPLLHSDYVRRTHLPHADFFIWHDDIEYTSRLADLGGGYLVPTSRIAHLVTNAGPGKLAPTRLYYDVRNRIWLALLATSFSRLGRLSIAIGAARVIARQSRGGIDFTTLITILRSIFHGFFRRPSRAYPTT